MGPRDYIGNAELEKVGFLNAKDKVRQLGMTIVQSVYYNMCPEYLNYFSIRQEMCIHMTQEVVIIIFGCQISTGTFNYNSIKQWNAMPDIKKSIVDKNTVKDLSMNVWVISQRESSTVITH